MVLLFFREIVGDSEDIVTRFREFVGPRDPELGRQLRPKSLRALYGKDKVQNAVHCSDLKNDGLLEVCFCFFNIIFIILLLSFDSCGWYMTNEILIR